MTATQSHILVVDDAVANRLVLKRMLEAQGHAVTTADDGDAALALIQAQAFDLVLLDVMMPVMDGYEVLAALRERPDWHRLPVVVVSAINDVESVVRCVSLGAADYLFKPVNQTLLKARVDSCLARKRVHDSELAAALALEAAQRAKSEYVSLISHELNNPITAIRGYADLLLKSIGGTLDGPQLEGLQAISALSRLMGELLHDLSDLSRIEAGHLQLLPGAVTLHTIVETSILAVQSNIAAKGQRLMVMLPPGLPPLWADGVRVVQLLTNLLSNASKYTLPGGSIQLDVCQRDAAMVEIAVRDTGIGISAEDQPRLFERFFRVNDPAARGERGTGLGLHITRLLVEAHGGQIWFESQPGVGTTFYCTLPLMLQSETDAVRPQSSLPPGVFQNR
ncbi:MAG: hybrid sensor histidine kinase/response regulator [Chloroflexales bacterium]|nr:hybrid sensor histidine kinase/response regulator [Chloroflexales bacterium]